MVGLLGDRLEFSFFGGDRFVAGVVGVVGVEALDVDGFGEVTERWLLLLLLLLLAAVVVFVGDGTGRVVLVLEGDFNTGGVLVGVLLLLVWLLLLGVSIFIFAISLSSLHSLWRFPTFNFKPEVTLLIVVVVVVKVMVNK